MAGEREVGAEVVSSTDDNSYDNTWMLKNDEKCSNHFYVGRSKKTHLDIGARTYHISILEVRQVH